MVKMTFSTFLLLVFIATVQSQECEPDQYLCEISRVCIPGDRICDNFIDCIGATDEIGCPVTTTTDCPGFKCPNGRCLAVPAYLCDGKNDCSDWTDESEETCPCGSNEFRCPRLPGDKHPRKCIPQSYVCDEDKIWDCTNGADEANCTM